MQKKLIGAALVGYGVAAGGYLANILPAQVAGIGIALVALVLGAALYMGYL